MFRIGLVLVIAILMLMSCQRDNAALPEFSCPVENGKTHTLRKAAELVLTGDTLGVPASPVYRVLSEHRIVFYNSLIHALDVYDLKDGGIAERIKLEEDGPHQVIGLLDFFWHNRDSIFVRSQSQVLLMDTGGKVTDRYELDYWSPEGFVFVDYFAEPYLELRLEYIPALRALQLYGVLPEGKLDKTCMVLYDIDRKQIIRTYGQYPEVYQRRDYFSLFDDPSAIVVGQKAYLSFGPDNGVYVHDILTGDLIESACGRSTSFPGTFQGIPIDKQNVQDMVNYETTAPLYLKLMYDPWRNVFYRFCKHAQPLKGEGGKMNHRWQGQWSILLLDDQLQTIGEYSIDGAAYDMLFSFVSEDGLNILLGPGHREEQLRYQTFEPYEI